MIKLYGTTTSPFVRRVAVVARELGQAFELVDTNVAENMARLRVLSPIWKVPIVEIGNEVIFDSHAIVDELILRYGHGPLRLGTDRTRIPERNFMQAVDAALESTIRRFYLRRDGTEPDTIPYMKKEGDRARAAMSWVEGQLRGAWCTEQPGFGLAELCLASTVGWMRFRNAYPVDDHPAIVAFERAHAERKSLMETVPRA